MKKGFRKIGVVKFLNLFKVDNGVDERNIIGFWAMTLLTLVILVEVLLNAFGREYEVNPNIYEVLFWTVLGSFGIVTAGNMVAGGLKSFSKKEPKEKEEDGERIVENLENTEERRK